MIRLQIDFKNKQREVPIVVSLKSIEGVVMAVLHLENRSADGLSLSLVSEKVIRNYHKRFFGDPSSTDCITLPLDADFEEAVPFRYLGDIFVCPKTALQYVKNDKKAFWKELSLYIVHAMLHLVGYDDITQLQQTTMRKKERHVMSFLAKKSLLLTGSFRSS